MTQASIDGAREQIFWLSPDGRFVFVNDCTCTELGYTRDELLDMNINMVELNLPGPWIEGFQKVKRDGALTYETTHRRKDGTRMPVEVNVIYVEHEGKEYNILFARDSTERKQLERSRASRSSRWTIRPTDLLARAQRNADLRERIDLQVARLHAGRDALPEHPRHRPQRRREVERALGTPYATEASSSSRRSTAPSRAGACPVEVNADLRGVRRPRVQLRLGHGHQRAQAMEEQLRLTQFSVDHSASQIFWVDEDAPPGGGQRIHVPPVGLHPRRDAQPDHLRHRSQAPQPWSSTGRG